MPEVNDKPTSNIPEVPTQPNPNVPVQLVTPLTSNPVVPTTGKENMGTNYQKLEANLIISLFF